jgi:Putative prokaryotic signal transducing protein
MTRATGTGGEKHGAAQAVWSGDDPVAYSRAMAALEEENILMFDLEEHDQFTVPQISGPRYRVIVAEVDAERARKAIREALGRDRAE